MGFLKGVVQCPDPTVLDGLAAVPTTSEALTFMTEFKDAHVVSMPNITVTALQLLSTHVVQFVLASDRVAPYVAIETELIGRFSDNNLLLLPWQPRKVAFISARPLTTADELASSLSLFSLSDTTLQL